jgi:hypothetical protein
VPLRKTYPILAVLLLLALMPASAFAAPPSNDTRDNAQPLQLGQRVNGTTVDATSDEDDADGCGQSDTPSVWYRIDGPRDGRAIVQLHANGDLDVTVDVYERIRSEDNSLSCDNSDRNGNASTEFRMKKGSSYLIRVSERARSASGTFSLLVDIGKPPATAPGRPLGKGGASGDVQRVFEPSNAYSTTLREGHSYRVNLAPDGCVSLSIYGPGVSSFDDESPRRVLRCGGYTLFTPGPHESGRYSFLIEPAGSRRDPQHYHLQVARAGRDDVTPGRFIRNFQRVRGTLNANRIDVVDIYRFDVVRRSITSLALSVPSGDDFSMTLVTAGGRRVSSGGTGESINVRTPPGRYYLAVRARHGAAGRYRLGRASKTITRTSLQPVPRKSSPGSTVALRVRVKPAVRGRVTVLVERFDPVSGWQFARRFETRTGSSGSVTVNYQPPSIGRYRARAFYNGTKVAAQSSSGTRFFRVVSPLQE